MSQNTFAQKDTIPFSNSYKHNIGLSSDLVSGSGISYRYWPNRYGVQITALPVFNKKKGHYVNIGITALYTINDGEKVDLYGFIGNHFSSSKTIFTDTYTNEKIIKVINSYNIGFGFGFKFELNQYLNFNLQTGYGFYDIPSNFNANLSAGVGLYYNFN